VCELLLRWLALEMLDAISKLFGGARRFLPPANSWRVAVRAPRVIRVDAVPSVYIASSHSLKSSPVNYRRTVTCMRQLSRLLRANCYSSSLRTCRPVFSTPPCPVYPTKCFATTPAHQRYKVQTRKADQVGMAGDMTTFKGKPFDRPSLESLMKVCIKQFMLSCSSHANEYSDASSTHPPLISMAVFLVSTTMAHPVAPLRTTSSTHGENTLC
jgi:hypothetical protein